VASEGRGDEGRPSSLGAAAPAAAQHAQAATQRFAQLLSDHAELAGEFERLAALAQGKGSGALNSAHEVRMVLAFCGAGPRLAIDVGAHQGEYAAELRRWEPTLEIHLFEPSSAHQQAREKRFEQDVGVMQVPAVRFEDYWKRQLDERPIDLVKIDDQGHEMQVLEGFGAALARTRVVQFKFGSVHIDTRTFFRDFWIFFAERGFDLYRLAPCGPVPVRAYREADEAFVVTNYLAVRRLQ
jgi:hypothetical protein